MGRWLAYIRLFSFDIVHVPGTKHKGPDSLSRRPATKEEEEERRQRGDKEEEEIEEAIEGALGRISAEKEEDVEEELAMVLRKHGSGEDDEMGRIARWLLTMERPTGMKDDAEFAKLKREATKYLIRDGILYRRAGVSPPRKVISLSEDKRRILERLHDESGHRGRDSTYNKIKNRFYWKGLYADVDKFVQSCE